MSARLEQLIKLTQIEPDDPMSHYGVGLECLSLQRWDDAVDAFGQAIKVDSTYAAAYYHRARAEIALQQPDVARATLKSGIEVARAAGDEHTVGEMRELSLSID